jgi:hypothetical protein
MKHEWKKQEKELYLPGTKPVLINVPEQKFIMLSGQGNPNGEEFAERLGVLYPIAYANQRPSVPLRACDQSRSCRYHTAMH